MAEIAVRMFDVHEIESRLIRDLRRMDEVLGVIFFGNDKPAAAEIPADIQAMLDERAAARKAKNWAESDRLRDAIAAAGWAVRDSKEGQTCTRIQ